MRFRCKSSFVLGDGFIFRLIFVMLKNLASRFSFHPGGNCCFFIFLVRDGAFIVFSSCVVDGTLSKVSLSGRMR